MATDILDLTRAYGRIVHSGKRLEMAFGNGSVLVAQRLPTGERAACLQDWGRETGLSYSGPAWRTATSPMEEMPTCTFFPVVGDW